ncbi:hypothetical protein HDU87_005056 [Geranomyces variabilis]|uniref:Uncharacterized protein n=1 Tax=Geranomyces variabilis TaxID=109894 RepID=A0AAD5TQF0_9FUNG|nr:hypothetical protein HDU87_005056 [Geranomyces variabilis]
MDQELERIVIHVAKDFQRNQIEVNRSVMRKIVKDATPNAAARPTSVCKKHSVPSTPPAAAEPGEHDARGSHHERSRGTHCPPYGLRRTWSASMRHLVYNLVTVSDVVEEEEVEQAVPMEVEPFIEVEESAPTPGATARWTGSLKRTFGRLGSRSPSPFRSASSPALSSKYKASSPATSSRLGGRLFSARPSPLRRELPVASTLTKAEAEAIRPKSDESGQVWQSIYAETEEEEDAADMAKAEEIQAQLDAEMSQPAKMELRERKGVPRMVQKAFTAAGHMIVGPQ